MKRFFLALILSACSAPGTPYTREQDAAPDVVDTCRECYCYTAPECSTAELNLACGCPKDCVAGPLETCRLGLVTDGVAYFCC